MVVYSPDTGLQHNEGAIAATSQPPPGHGVLYENVDLLSSTVKTTQLYENISTVSSAHHQNNIEMNQCTDDRLVAEQQHLHPAAIALPPRLPALYPKPHPQT